MTRGPCRGPRSGLFADLRLQVDGLPRMHVRLLRKPACWNVSEVAPHHEASSRDRCVCHMNLNVQRRCASLGGTQQATIFPALLCRNIGAAFRYQTTGLCKSCVWYVLFHVLWGNWDPTDSGATGTQQTKFHFSESRKVPVVCHTAHSMHTCTVYEILHRRVEFQSMIHPCTTKSVCLSHHERG